KVEPGHAASHPCAMLRPVKGARRPCWRHLRTDELRDEAAFAGEARINEKLERADAAFGCQELDIDDLRILAAGIIHGGHRCPYRITSTVGCATSMTIP